MKSRPSSTTCANSAPDGPDFPRESGGVRLRRSRRRRGADLLGRRAGRGDQLGVATAVHRWGLGSRRDPGLERARPARLLPPRRGRRGRQGGDQRAVLRQLANAAAPDPGQAPVAARRWLEGADLRSSRLLRPVGSTRVEDERPRPAVHTRRDGPRARRCRAAAGCQRFVRRQPAHPRSRRHCVSAWSPARPARRGATSPTSSIAAAWPSVSASSTCACRASGPSTWSRRPCAR